MENLREILSIGKAVIISEGKTKDGETKTVLTKIADIKKNANGRTYPARILKREVERVQKQIESGGFFGTAEHPAWGNQTVTNASHIVQKMFFDEKVGEAWASLKIIPTTKGKDVMTLIKNGAQLGVSTRGTGSVSKDGTVQDDYKMLGVDIVGSPSSQVARFDQSNIFESVGFEEKEEGTKMKKTSEEFIQKMLRDNYEATARSSRYDNSLGTDKTFEQWCADGGEALTRASIRHYIDGEFGSIEEALQEMGEGQMAVVYIAEQKKVTPAECYTEARIAGVDPAKMASIINASVDEKVHAIGTGWSEEERKVIYESARRAGKDISTAEARKKLLDETKVLPEDDKETLFENSVRARYEVLKEEGPEIPINDVRKCMKIQREKEEKEEIKRGRIRTFVAENLIAGPKKVFK